MNRLACLFALVPSFAFAQYKMEPAGAAPAEVPAAISSLLQPQGFKIMTPAGQVFCEIWFRSALPSGPKSTEQDVAFPTIPHGTLLGVIRFPGNGADRRGQMIKAGIYTLRYSLYPVTGDHLGVAPQRDFALIVPLADDKDPNNLPNFNQVVAMSKKASGTPHPAVLSIAPSSSEKFPNFTKENDHDWTLHVKIGDVGFSIILVGKVEG